MCGTAASLLQPAAAFALRLPAADIHVRVWWARASMWACAQWQCKLLCSGRRACFMMWLGWAYLTKAVHKPQRRGVNFDPL